MVVIEVVLQRPEVVVMESAAELDLDALSHFRVGGNVYFEFLQALPPALPVLDSQLEQFELQGGQDLMADGIEVEDEVLHAGMEGELPRVSFHQHVILDEAFGKDVVRSFFSYFRQSIESRRSASSSSRGTASSKGSSWSCSTLVWLDWSSCAAASGKAVCSGDESGGSSSKSGADSG